MLETLLKDDKRIAPDILADCLRENEAAGASFGEILIARGVLTEDDLLNVLSTRLTIPRISIEENSIDTTAIQEISAKAAAHYRCMPLGKEGDAIKVALSYKLNFSVLDEMRLVFGQKILPFLTTEAEIEKAMKLHYGIGADTLERLVDATQSQMGPDTAGEHDLGTNQDASVSRFVNQMFLEAFESRATDIHLEPYAQNFRVRYRIDGVLYEGKISESLKRFQASITSRIKIMARLSISEKRMPQDGRIVVQVKGQEMDLRVSTLPTPFGESIGIRFLTSRQFLDLPHLGFGGDHLRQLRSFLVKPHGLLFLTGPTGSGKTTTLYAFLNEINKTDKKIITLEDPIEYQMAGITQVQVYPKVGLTFAHGLRAMLRHDPDVMMVGEVRDFETAEVAIRVALTGHLVFSTLHTNDAAGAITRLKDIGVLPYLISSSVLCVVAQRLVRVICKECKINAALRREFVDELGLESTDCTVYYGKGCKACNGSGYRGRTAIYEILPINPSIQEAVLDGTSANKIRDLAIKGGMRTLRQCGLNKIFEGITTPDEVIRATLQEGA